MPIIRCPDVAAAGWVPYRPWTRPLPPGFAGYARARRRYGVSFGLKTLFWTGNDAPPTAWADLAHIDWYLGALDYRGFLLMTDVELVCGDDGRPLDIRCAYLGDVRAVGFTPMPVLRRVPYRWARRLTFHPGDGGVLPLEQGVDAAGGWLGLEVRFRLGRVGNYAGRAMTGYWAPDAWMRVDYRVEASGAYQITCTGSGIPSQRVYRGGARVYDHDAARLSAAGVAGFIQAGYAVRAPTAHRRVL